MAADAPRQYLTATADGAFRATTTATNSAASTLTRVTYPALGTGVRPVNPEATNATAGTVPAGPNSTPRGIGWRAPAMDDEFIGWEEGQSWDAAMFIASSSSLTLTIHCIAYLDGQEVARGESAAVAVTSGVQRAIPMTTTARISATAVPRLTFEFYVEATGLNANAISTTTVTISTGGTNSYVDPGTYFINYVRTAPETAPDSLDSTLRTQSDFRRVSEEEAVAAASATRTTTGVRTAEVASPAATDAASSSEIYSRSASDAGSATTDAAARTQADFRRAPESASVPQADAALRVVDFWRTVADVTVQDASAIKLVTYGRAVRHQFAPGDDPLLDPTRTIEGTVRMPDNSAYLGEATVYLVRSDDVVVASTTSSPVDGSYVFLRNSYDAATYYVVAFADGATPREGVTERGLVPA